MNIRISLGLVPLLLACISCKQNNKDVSSTTSLIGEVINNTEPLSRPVIWAVDDSTAYLTSFSDKFLIDRIKIELDSAYIIERIGKKGAGPFEMPYSTASFSIDTKQLLLYNSNTKKLIEYNMSANVDSCLYIDIMHNWPIGAVLHNITHLENNDLLCSVRWITDSLASETSKPWFLRICRSDNSVHPISGFDIDDNKSVPIHTKGLLYVPNSRFVRRPNSNQFIYTADNSQYMEIFTIENDSIHNRRIILNQLPEYTVDETTGMPKIKSGNTAYGILPAVTDKFIYCLMPRCTTNELKQILMGNTPDKFIGTACDYQFKGEIHVYDWNGNFIKSINLFPMVINIVVSQNDKYIYGMSEDENSETRFMRYSLPD